MNYTRHNKLLKWLDNFYRPRGKYLVMTISFIVMFIMLSGWLVYTQGGAQSVYVHMFYIPIILAAFAFRFTGGIVVAVICGLISNSILALDIVNASSQSFSAVLFRTVMFCFIGGAVGCIASGMRSRIETTEHLVDKMSSIYAGTLKTYASVVEFRDEHTAGHCHRVAYNAYQVGNALGFSQRELEILYWSGLLHDLGKIAISEHILRKPGKLTPEEYEEIKKHTEIGYQMIHSTSPDFEQIAQGIRSHHEKWNGEGYPDRKKGAEIPIYGRIVSVVDVFEALTSDRPYRKPMSEAQALSHLEQKAGSHFDPHIVKVFVQLYECRKIWVSEKPQPILKYDAPQKLYLELLTANRFGR